MTRAIGWFVAFVGFLCLVVFGAASAFLGAPPDFVKWVGGIGAGLIVLWLIADWKNLSRIGEDQTVGRSFTAAFATVLMLAIIVVVNIAVYRYDDRWDLTASQRYTLSQQSIDLVSKLDREVKVHAFFPNTDPGGKNFRALVDEYQEHSSQLAVEFHDPYQDKLLADQLKR